MAFELITEMATHLTTKKTHPHFDDLTLNH